MSKSKMKQLIIDTAWELFHQKGYENTTIADILRACNIAKGSFYYHFNGKEDLLETLAFVLDRKYESLMPDLNESDNAIDQLLFLSNKLHGYIEDHIDRALLANLYATRLTSPSPCSLTDHHRVYFRLLYQIITRGQSRGEILPHLDPWEMADYYSLCEWGIIMRWCLNRGFPTLSESTLKYMPLMIQAFDSRSKPTSRLTTI